MDNIFGDLLEKQQKYRGREVPLEEVLQDACPHENTIDVGDSDHVKVACTDCEKILGNEKCPGCRSPLVTKIEERQGGHSGTVSYCNGCGYTATS
jgi:RNase P subunit RPR2